MKTNKPKISFTSSPEAFAEPRTREEATADRLDEQRQADAPVPPRAGPLEDATAAESFQPKAAPQPESGAVQNDIFDRAAWEERLTAPPEPAPVAAPIPAPQPKPKATVQNTKLAAFGQMSPPEQGFFARNAGMLGSAAAIVAIFCVGFVLTTGFFGSDEDTLREQAMFSTPAPASDVATRALTPDMTDVSTVGPVATGLQPPTPVAQPPVSVSAPVSAEARLIEEALKTLSSNKIRMLKEGVLADIYEVEKYDRNGVERVRLRSVNTALTSEQASGALLAATAAGQINMSPALLTTEGIVDVETMMFNLVQTSLRNENTPASAAAARDMSRKIFAASVARSENLNGLRYYRVQEGDSLAYIALQFYGNPTAYKRILEANLNTLQSPEQIQLGQRLVIPS